MSRDGTRLYAAKGTASMRPLFGPQPPRLLIVDLARGTLIRAVALDADGAASVYAPSAESEPLGNSAMHR